MQIIIYKNDAGGVAIVYPTTNELVRQSINAIANADVPTGKPYKIVNIEDLPLDGTFNDLGVPNIDKAFRDAWTIDEALLTDGVGS